MKIKLTILAIILGISTTIYAKNDSTLNREVYLSVNSILNMDFDLQYKHPLKNNRYLRISLISINTNYDSHNTSISNTFPTSNTHFSGGINIGFEKRKLYNSKISYFYGIDFLNKYFQQDINVKNPQIPVHHRTLKRYTISTGVGINFGLILNIKNNFHASIEIMPSFLYKYSEYEYLNNGSINNFYRHDFEQSFDTKNVNVSLVYILNNNSK